MPVPRTLTLSPVAQVALEQLRDHDPRPYRRERATALLKIAAGASVRHVARTGLLVPRRPETVATWLDRYLAEGVNGLMQRPRTRRGLSPPRRRDLG